MPLSERFAKLANDAKTRIREVSAAEARDVQARGGLLIDIRETEDFAKEHAAGAIHLSKGVLEMKIEKTAPDIATPIVCYCGGGNRSALSADNLQKMGYTNVASMTGGFKAWKEQGLGVEAKP
jgi:rhodanese-related sulfurtransferase